MPRSTMLRTLHHHMPRKPHTRSQGPLPDPPVRVQHPRLRTEEPRFGFHEGRFHCGAVEEQLNGAQLRLSPASLQESTLPNGGFGVVVREDVPVNTKVLEYGGELITLEEAKRRKKKVIDFIFISSHIPPRYTWFPSSCISGDFWP